MRPDRPLRAKPLRDWRINVVIALTVLVVAFLAVGTPAVIQSSNTTRQIQRGNDLQACRSIANADVTRARATLDERGVDSDVLINRFVEAVIARDTETLRSLRDQLPDIRSALVAAADDLRSKTDLYNAAVQLSSQDPDQFLTNCQEQP